MTTEWIIIEIIANTTDVLTIFFLLCRKFESKYRTLLPTLIFELLGIIAMSIPIFVTWEYYSTEIVCFAIFMAFLLIFRKGSVWNKFFWGVLVYTFIFAIAFFLLPIISFFTREDSQDILLMGGSSARLYYLILAYIVRIVIFFILSLKKKYIYENIYSLILCFLIPLVTFISGVGLYEIYLTHVDIIPNQIAYIVSSSYLLINVIVFALYERLSKEAEKNYMLLAKQKQYEITTEHNIEVAQIYADIKEWQHDFKHHMQLVRSLLQNQDYIQAKKYLDELDEKVLMSSLRVSTGNYLVDAILSSKIATATANNIPLGYTAQVPEYLNINNVDLCAILSNLLDNAIEACRKIDGETYIKCEVMLIKSQLYIHITNSSDGKYIKVSEGFMSTKKGALHGIGLSHVQSIVSQYNGLYNVKAEKDYFETKISIPVKISQ